MRKAREALSQGLCAKIQNYDPYYLKNSPLVPYLVRIVPYSEFSHSVQINEQNGSRFAFIGGNHIGSCYFQPTGCSQACFFCLGKDGFE